MLCPNLAEFAMPSHDEPPAIPPAVAEFVRQAAAAADRPEQTRALLQLIQAVTTATVAGSVFRLLTRSGSGGLRLALEFLARLPWKIPADLIREATPHLTDRSIPLPVRLSAAAAILSSVPDEPRAVGTVVRAVTAGLTRSRALERMYQLQSRVEECEALDALVATSEGRVRMRCPRCPARLTRRELVPHLWHRHRLAFQNGQARDPRTLLDAVITAAAASRDVSEIDRAFLLTAHYFPEAGPRQVLQALAARGAYDPTQTDRLLKLAAEERAGLCPVCLTAMPDPVPQLPPPANASGGRVSADGYAVDVDDLPAGRTFTVTLPRARPNRRYDDPLRRSPRKIAALVALPLMLMAAAVVLIIPSRVAHPAWVAAWLGLVGWMVYLAVRLARRPLPDRTERAVELAWTKLAPLVGRTPPAVHFLTRLARASIGVGDVGERAALVFELVQHAAVLAEKGGPYQQFLAVVRVLEVLDQGRLGRERVAGLVGVFEPFLRGELGPAYAEAAAETVLTSDALPAGDMRRLGVLVVEAAFENGLVPTDLVTVGRFCPWFRRVILDARPDHLALLYAVWRGRNTRPWSAVGDAATVFELARETPAAGRRILAEFPDTLLRTEVGEAIEAEIGPVLVAARGVVVAGSVVADPDAAVDLARLPGGWRLQFGPHRFQLTSRISYRIVDDLRKWLKYRAATLLPEAERTPPRGTGLRAVGMVAPLAVACPLCGTRSVVRTGQIGTPWQALGGHQGIDRVGSS
jgi:predicted RNA-binding Zn-ribbon protein involved in translation (DUF1610 family)